MTNTDQIDVEVTAVEREADGIGSWEFRRPDGGDLPPFTAGSHIDLHLANGLTRSYSLCNSQDDSDRYVVAINKDPNSRGGSVWIHENLKVGDRLRISAPRNHFPLVEDADHVVLIAGGIGITPMLCMLKRLDSLGKSWELFYSSRTRDTCAFKDELEAIEAVKGGRVHLNFDKEPGGKMTDLREVIGNAPAGAHLYCCGPNLMLDAFVGTAKDLGRPSENVHVEYFAAKEEAALDGGYTIELARTGTSIEIEPGVTILDALLDEGIDIPYSCMEGVCGTCEVGVLEGVPDHRDAVYSEEERAANNKLLVCCSGSKSAKLVLDI